MIEATTQSHWHAREYIAPTAFALTVVACLPILAALALFARPLLLGLAGLLIVGAAARILVQNQARRRQLARRSRRDYRGLTMPDDVALDCGHCWVWLDDEAVVGADDYVQRVLGPIDRVDLPQAGGHVDRGDRLFSLCHGERCIELPAPISGTIVDVNEELRRHPEIINEHPFEQGWVARIRGDHLREDRRQLLFGRKAAQWFRREVDFLFRSLPGSDAGEIYTRIDDSAWSVLHRSFGGRRAA